jgi:hypothetical protein
MSAVRASGPGEAIDKDAALQIAAEFPFQIGRNARSVPLVRCEREVGFQVLLDDLVEDRLLGTATAISDRRASR